MGQSVKAMEDCDTIYAMHYLLAKIVLKALASEAVGASKKKKKMMMMMMKEVKFSSFDNCRFATLPMLYDNVIHQVSHKNH